MTDDELAIIWLDYFDFLGYKKKKMFLDLFLSPSDMLYSENIFDNASQIKTIISSEEYSLLIGLLGRTFAESLVEDMKDCGISFTTIYSSDYPQSLKDIDTPPFVIYYMGDKSLLSTQCLAIVGSRHITSYGKMVTEKFAKALSMAGFTIVSGLASGVDTIAHTVTLDVHGKTIAVLAGGLPDIYPPTNTSLAHRIVSEGGLILTEARPHRHLESFLFPIRNRIISALSKGILITEAQEKSGVIHTKNYALEYGKDVFAVPGSIFNTSSSGSNRMIVNGQAKAVIDVDDILSEYSLHYQPVQQRIEIKVDGDEGKIIEILKSGEKTFQEICDISGIDAKSLNSILTLMTIKGEVRKMAGNVFFLIK